MEPNAFLITVGSQQGIVIEGLAVSHLGLEEFGFIFAMTGLQEVPLPPVIVWRMLNVAERAILMIAESNQAIIVVEQVA